MLSVTTGLSRALYGLVKTLALLLATMDMLSRSSLYSCLWLSSEAEH